MLFAAGSLDYLAGALDILAHAGDGVAACDGQCYEREGEYLFHVIP
jgi:hypothetical protein